MACGDGLAWLRSIASGAGRGKGKAAAAGSPVLTVRLGVAVAEDEARSKGSRWMSTRWCHYVDVVGSSGSACGGCRGRARGDAATDDVAVFQSRWLEAERAGAVR